MSVDAYADVVVVGGGPAGSCCARELALRGFHTLLLEEHETVASKVLCTGIIGINAFEEFPLPWESVVGTLGRMKAVSRYGTELPYTPSQPIAYIVDKGAFNSALAAQANAAGVLVRTRPRAYTTSPSTPTGYICKRSCGVSNPSECTRSWLSWPAGCTIT
jgi:flavin-dependent dehydrogenase